MDNKDIFNMITLLDRKFTTFAQQAGYEFDLEGNATRVGKPSQVAEKAVAGRFKPPTANEVALHFKDKGLNPSHALTEAEKFVDFYASKGWKVGKEKMKLWKSAASNWARRSSEDAQEKAVNKPAKRRSFEELARGDHLEDLNSKRQAIAAQSGDQRVIANVSAEDEFAKLEQQYRLGN